VLGVYRGRPEHRALSPLTVTLKGSSKPLIDHADLVKAVDVMAAGPGVYFVGVRRAVKNPYGVELVNIARVHEFGIPEGIVPKRTKWLAIPASKKAAEAARRAGSVRAIDEDLFVPKTAGKMTRVLAKRVGTKLEVWFILTKKVVIPARPFIYPGFQDAERRCLNNWERCLKLTLMGQPYTPGAAA
jgi:hypothetical protein